MNVIIHDQNRGDGRKVSFCGCPDLEVTDSDPNIGNAAVADGKTFHVLTHLYDSSNSFVSRNELNICIHFMLWKRVVRGNLLETWK